MDEEQEDRTYSLTTIIIVVLIALVLWTAILTIYFDKVHKDEMQDLRTDKNEVISSLTEGYENLRDQFLNTGQAETAPPTAEEVVGEGQTVPTIAGEQIPGPQGPPPTDEQVRTAVVAYLEEHPPASGRPPTDQEVAAAVAAFCEARGGCIGPPGSNGRDGEDGEPGPAPTAEQILSAVASFCGQNNGCIGPPGPAVNSFQFTFLLNTYVCDDPDGDLNYSCTVQP